MSENKMEQVAKLLGVEIGGQFMIKGRQGAIYELQKDGIYIIDCQGRGVNSAQTLLDLLRGETEVVNLLWRPKFGESYWYISTNGLECRAEWKNVGIDQLFLKLGNVFKDKREARENADAFLAFLESADIWRTGNGTDN